MIDINQLRQELIAACESSPKPVSASKQKVERQLMCEFKISEFEHWCPLYALNGEIRTEISGCSITEALSFAYGFDEAKIESHHNQEFYNLGREFAERYP